MRMPENLEKTSVKVALVLALVIIWGYNSYSILDITEAGKLNANENDSTVTVSELSIPSHQQFEYNGDFRDPFIPLITKRVQKQEPSPQKTTPEPIKLPKLQVTGIVENMALIQDERQNLFFVSRGDSIGEAYVLFVTEDSVGLVFKKRKFNLKF